VGDKSWEAVILEDFEKGVLGGATAWPLAVWTQLSPGEDIMHKTSAEMDVVWRQAAQ
jgi:hypothetical protein